jgi:hypothetical protein
LIGKRVDGRSQQEPTVDPNTHHAAREYTTPKGTLAKRIIDDLVAHKKVRPWIGTLPRPRISQRRTIGDVIAAAKVSLKTSSNHKHASSPRLAQLSISQCPSMAVNQGPNPGSGESGSERNLGEKPACTVGGSNANRSRFRGAGQGKRTLCF